MSCWLVAWARETEVWVSILPGLRLVTWSPQQKTKVGVRLLPCVSHKELFLERFPLSGHSAGASTLTPICLLLVLQMRTQTWEVGRCPGPHHLQATDGDVKPGLSRSCLREKGCGGM